MRPLFSIMGTIILLLNSSFLLAQEDNKVIKIAAGEWPPFIGQELENFGQVGKTIQEVFAQQGYQVEFHFLPWKRAFSKTNDGEFVATAVWMYTEERAELFHYSDPVAQEQFVFFHLKDSPFEWQTLSDIQGSHLGGGLGYSYGEQLDSMIEKEQVTIHRVEGVQKAFQLLEYQRVDLFPEEKHIGLFYLDKMPIETQEKITYHPTPFLANDSYLMFSKNHPEADKLLNLFNQGLATLKEAH
ncbi:substrate-binding periplasmic protein [Vibrio amylolyticus]|uniref:substrate-binding periplasmic protein n=1 Tax=Vibrio amylolyticus TaxID=2847292 RepID=UPI00354DD4D6